MTSKLLHDADRLRTFALVFQTGDSAVEGPRAPGSDGAVRSNRRVQPRDVGYFEVDRKDHRRIQFDEQVEVLMLAGNFGMKSGEPALHAHVVLGRFDGSACGGHLLEATVRLTFEVIVIETPHDLQRRLNRMSGLALITM